MTKIEFEIEVLHARIATLEAEVDALKAKQCECSKQSTPPSEQLEFHHHWH